METSRKDAVFFGINERKLAWCRAGKKGSDRRKNGESGAMTWGEKMRVDESRKQKGVHPLERGGEAKEELRKSGDSKKT